MLSEFVGSSSSLLSGLPKLTEKIRKSTLGFDINELSPPKIILRDNLFVQLPTVRPELGQRVCDIPSKKRIAECIHNDFPYGGNIAFLGDDDLVSLALAKNIYNIEIFDIDNRIYDIIYSEDDIMYRKHNVIYSIDESLQNSFDAVILDPADGSVALVHWFNRVFELISHKEGARVYISFNPFRLGKRWACVLEQLHRHSLIPVGMKESIKHYDSEEGTITTNLWIFEKQNLASTLPLPYLDVEEFR